MRQQRKHRLGAEEALRPCRQLGLDEAVAPDSRLIFRMEVERLADEKRWTLEYSGTSEPSWRSRPQCHGGELPAPLRVRAVRRGGAELQRPGRLGRRGAARPRAELRVAKADVHDEHGARRALRPEQRAPRQCLCPRQRPATLGSMLRVPGRDLAGNQQLQQAFIARPQRVECKRLPHLVAPGAARKGSARAGQLAQGGRLQVRDERREEVLGDTAKTCHGTKISNLRSKIWKSRGCPNYDPTSRMGMS
mmetsp:Transcript_12080/g.30226  ORF Transcript_12080/g.30226 Transcript_12080/m.30226 type:complete len:249 (-) Transcript_12080:1-747(-)